MYLKIHKSQDRDIIAICDSNLIGKKFSDKSGLYLDVSEGFYRGKEVSEEEAFKVVKEGKNNSSIFNIVGKKSIDFALKNGIIEKENIVKINNIPHAQSI